MICLDKMNVLLRGCFVAAKTKLSEQKIGLCQYDVCQENKIK